MASLQEVARAVIHTLDGGTAGAYNCKAMTPKPPTFALKFTKPELNALMHAVFETKCADLVKKDRDNFGALNLIDLKLNALWQKYAKAEQSTQESEDDTFTEEDLIANTSRRSKEDETYELCYRNILANPELQFVHKDCGGIISESPKTSKLLACGNQWECFRCNVEGVPNLDFQDEDDTRPYMIGDSKTCVVEMLIEVSDEEINEFLQSQGLAPLAEYELDDEEIEELEEVEEDGEFPVQ